MGFLDYKMSHRGGSESIIRCHRETTESIVDGIFINLNYCPYYTFKMTLLLYTNIFVDI